jgi:PAS domain S-box-containing protein
MKTVGDLAQPELFRTAVDTMETGVAICESTEGRIQYVNDSCAALLDTTRSELVGRHICDLLTAVSRDQFDTYTDSLSEGETASTNTTYSFGESQVPVTEITTQRTVDGEQYLLKMVSDSIDQQKNEQILKRQNDKLQSQCEQLERQKQQFESFAKVASHDLRNPLSIAQGYLTMAQEESATDSLETVSDALSRMEALIDDLLSLAEKGEAVGDIEAVSLERIANCAWTNTRTFDAELTVEEYDIYADPVRTQQLFENLFRNAIEHAGTDIQVHVGGMSKISTSMRVDAETEMATGFHVSDTGPGVPPSDRETVFSESYTTAEDGTGLGLHTVKEIAAAHGWQTRCDESRDGGARFEFIGTSTKSGS